MADSQIEELTFVGFVKENYSDNIKSEKLTKTLNQLVWLRNMLKRKQIKCICSEVSAVLSNGGFYGRV